MTEKTNRNVADRLRKVAGLVPTAVAIAQPEGKPPASGPRSYRVITFAELDQQTDAIARGLIEWGVTPGTRLAMLVPFGIDFLMLTFGLLKAGATVVLIDPGMGRRNLIDCLAAAQPEGFIAIPRAQLIRAALRKRFPQAVWNVTVGSKRWSGKQTLSEITKRGAASQVALPTRQDSDSAAVIFTTGSTGPPKGVQYTHGIFNHQVDLIRKRYNIRPGGRDLACFPLFGLFDAMMGVTTVIPDMDPTKPADINPKRVLEAVEQWEINQAFGSPALWNTVATWCREHHQKLPTLTRVLSAGAPVPPKTLAMLRDIIAPDAEIFTPYGATESLPIASIESREVLEETAHQSRQGAGTCVGSRFEQMEWRVIRITDGPLESIDQIEELAVGEIGELMVCGPVVTREYVTRSEQNALHKVRDGDRIWHRVGDVGYLDSKDRFWFCGRKGHRVQTNAGVLYTVPCEAIFNNHQDVFRSALIGIGEAPNQQAVLVIEPYKGARPKGRPATERLIAELQQLAGSNPLTASIQDIRIHPRKLPVDIRHNSKIFREQLAVEYQR
ncbi:Long-chain-fatty-acid--CoA ligase [Roseimaritima multifibrata]|uniref:Long-chain-fatty-acid--CoA ligase n=1 Tax=Roseimaritima multifibrata TaxID=1930274 RepID=A0A517MKX2_9BACT|nr:fatty acid CoA ligase family protein [Roseimaritima multifibrata]QDS95538.1 Long-chain-fatty-acid--CoA ligase [Roseimaritima multifibrata]